ncbi:ATP-binding protein [Streptomyces sp. NBC_00264]|uniref:ATP-binding protein n=1 Tax=unclassified Streptomyces TaxID=2593676 RepID=UPI00225BFDDB|nr:MULTISPECIES: ATP-binding protein [unclassified Streptomyces]MCX5161857.1 ATP-binding protein [Streptomyces sp. NBC_00305]MCX5220380.1 ATP-binding protein [Streptomyces sp. NBC_00264]
MASLLPNALRLCCPPPRVPSRCMLPSGPEAPAAARRFVVELLAYQAPDLAEETREDVRLVVSELVTNSYRYGTEPGDSLLVEVVAAADVVLVEVHDPQRKRPQYKPESKERQRGRGLFILDALAARWDVDDRLFGKVVWAEVAR